MVWISLRPTFELSVENDLEQVRQRLAECRQSGVYPRFRMTGEYGDLHLPQEENRLWSPHLSFFVLADGDGTRLHGRYAPRWEIWSLVWAVYMAMICIVFFGSIFAYCQWMLGNRMWGRAAVVVAIAIILILHIVATLGQWHCRDQMTSLRAELDQILQSAELTATGSSEVSKFLDLQSEH